MHFVYESGGLGVWMGVGCPCSPIRNNIVTPRHLFDNIRGLMKLLVTVELSTDKDNFECADPGLVKEGPTACEEHQTPIGKLV